MYRTPSAYAAQTIEPTKPRLARASVRVTFALVLFGLSAQFSGCSAATPQNPLAAAGVSHFPHGDSFLIFAIPSEGEEGDTSYVQNSRVYGVSPLASRLANLLATGERKELRIVVGGPSSEKSAQVVLDALKLNKSQMLGGVVLVFVGSKRDAERIRVALEPRLGTLLYSSLPAGIPNESRS